MSNDPNRPVKNPLFNPNVTGSTFEDFAQHAQIYPAQELSLASSESVCGPDQRAIQFGETPVEFHQDVNLSPFNQFGQNINQFDQNINQFDQNINQFDQNINQSVQSISLDQSHQNINFDYPHQQSNVTSLITSFSNFWRGPVAPPQPVQEFAGSPVPDIPGPRIVPGSSPAPPPPLYSPADVHLPDPPSLPAGPPLNTSNTYRRVGTKRAVYAPIPGLSRGDAPSVPPANVSSPTSVFGQVEPQLRPSPSITPKSAFYQEVRPETNSSPFLSPVQDFMLTTDSETTFPMAAGNEGSSNLPYAYRGDGSFLPTAVIDQSQAIYRPVYHHWFHKKQVEGRTVWETFSMHDSQNLETAFTSPELSPDTVVATDGGRFDVNILRRERASVYWTSEPTEVRRCSWFYKGSTDGKYVPFDENIATKLEEEFKQAFESNVWHRKVEIPNGETVMFHGADVLVLFPAIQSPDAWGNTPSQPRPIVVKRGMDEFDIDEGESETVDHLLLMVHGIGAACDLKFRSVEEVVDEFRSIALQLIKAHYRSSCDRKLVNRIEILPVGWHEKLHSEDTGIDKKLKSITLESIPKLREFTNDTLLDILFYTSPIYGQTITSSVSAELNRIHELFKERNPTFKGAVSLGGHSLGSLILFDILRHQQPPSEPSSSVPSDEDGVSPLTPKPPPMQRRMSRQISYVMGAVGTGQADITYPQLSFQPHTFFAFGSPIGMFVTVRGLDNLGLDFKLPTCQGFFNIFHPYDPVAYRIEALINPQLAEVKPVLIPHHKGRKRMHLELKETMTRVGADLKQKLIDSMKNTWHSIFQLGWANKPQIQPNIEEEVDKVLQEGFANDNSQDESTIDGAQNDKVEFNLGQLNKGRRIDYVLQEAPVEFFNEYIFTLSSHLCYWESEDTILMIIKEIYNNLEVTPDCQIPQQTMTIERPPPSPNTARAQLATSAAMGVDPTLPMSRNANVGPPPMSGFVKKS